MAIKVSIMNDMKEQLKNESLSLEFYKDINDLLQNTIVDVCKNNNIAENRLNFFIAGDHVLNTNLAGLSPLVIFISLKENKEQVIAYSKMQKLNKKTQRLAQMPNVITDQMLAGMMFKELIKQLDENTKIFNSKNVIMVNLDNMIKVKIIVGYNFNGSFEYEYLGDYYKENFLSLIEQFDNKEQATKNYYDVVRIIKSIEFEMLSFGVLKEKSFDTLNFIETLIYNVPNELLIDDNFYNAFVKSLNYLKNADLHNFKLANKNEFMFNSRNTNSYSIKKAKTLIQLIDFFFKNFEKIYKTAV